MCSRVRLTQSSGAVSPGSSSAHGIAHLAWRVTWSRQFTSGARKKEDGEPKLDCTQPAGSALTLAYDGSTGVLPTSMSMEVMAAYLVVSTWSQMNQSAEVRGKVDPRKKEQLDLTLSKMVRSGSGPRTQPHVAISNGMFNASWAVEKDKGQRGVKSSASLPKTLYTPTSHGRIEIINSLCKSRILARHLVPLPACNMEIKRGKLKGRLKILQSSFGVQIFRHQTTNLLASRSSRGRSDRNS